jgi:4-aminobutyrate aminotransferase/diaminobutyrate-pyruvate transaminase/4-aminobutyrate aminotransferase/(S)-3-amino-2-methylpropionate transaminase
VEADFLCLGKGLSSSLPISAVLGRSEIVNIFAPGSMTSTHTGSPICAAAALANLEVIKKEKLVQNAAKLDPVLKAFVTEMRKTYPDRVGFVASVGLVGAIQMVAKPGSTEPDHPTAFEIIKYCIEHGLLMFAPVGTGGGTVKICPPLCINKDQFQEGLGVLRDAFAFVLAKKTED